MSPTPKQIGMKLKAQREAKGLSQDALAKKAKLAREYVNRLEAGRHDPTVGTLERLAKALGIGVTKFLR